MLFFILSMQPDQRPHWFSYWIVKEPDDMMLIVEEVRRLCTQQNRTYVAMWKFDLKEPLLTTCRKLHERFGEKLRKVCMYKFADGYTKAQGCTVLADEEMDMSEREICEADGSAIVLFDAAFGFGAFCGRHDKNEA
jgi:hypothetical protein